MRHRPTNFVKFPPKGIKSEYKTKAEKMLDPERRSRMDACLGTVLMAVCVHDLLPAPWQELAVFVSAFRQTRVGEPIPCRLELGVNPGAMR